MFKEKNNDNDAQGSASPTNPSGTPPQGGYQSQPLPGQAPQGNVADQANWNPNDQNDDLPF